MKNNETIKTEPIDYIDLGRGWVNLVKEIKPVARPDIEKGRPEVRYEK